MGYGGTGVDLPGLLPLDKKHPDVKYIFRSGEVDDDYEVEKDPIARGKFASVRLARHRLTKRIYAAKFLRRRGRAVSLESEARHEISVLLLGRTDPYIIQLHQVYEARSEYVILLEYGSGGDLQRLLDDQSRFQEKTVRDLLVQVLRGLTFLHEKRIAHLDIKPQNLVLMGPTPEEGVKLVDFGLSRLILDNVELTQIMGTPDYVAPEVINFEPVGLATDMWAIGVLTYVFLTGCTPFGGNTDQDTFVNITQGEYDFPDDLFGDVSNLAKDFISSLLLKPPLSRMTVDQSMNHSWMCATTLSEADSADSGYSTEILNGSPPTNLTNGYMSYSIPSLTCHSSIIREDTFDHQSPPCDLHSSELLLKYCKHKPRMRLNSDSSAFTRHSQDAERKHRVSTGHMSINVMESLHENPRPQHFRSLRRNSLIIDDQDSTGYSVDPLNKYGSLKIKKRSPKSSNLCSFQEEFSNRNLDKEIYDTDSWSNHEKRYPETVLDQSVLRNIAKPWENLCDGSYYRALNQLQTKGSKKSKNKQNYFGLRPEMSYSMYDLKTVTDASLYQSSDLSLSKSDYKRSDLRKSKNDLRGSKSDLRKLKSELRGSKSELRPSKSELRPASSELNLRNAGTRSYNRDFGRLGEPTPTKSGKRPKSDMKKSKVDAAMLGKLNLSSHEAIAKLNMSLSKLDLSRDAKNTEESEERDVVYGDFTLPRRFHRNSVSPMLRGNSLHMSFRLPKKRDGKM